VRILAPVTAIRRLSTLAARMAAAVRDAHDPAQAQINACAAFAAWTQQNGIAAEAACAGYPGDSRVHDVLAAAGWQHIHQHFKAANPFDDIRIHFCEAFLAQCSPDERKRRGVYYTPQAVATFMVRGIDHLLSTHFQLEDGIASQITWRGIERQLGVPIPAGIAADALFLTFFDPAAGAGLFLIEVVKQIHARLLARWNRQALPATQIEDNWRRYVKQLLPRLRGFEIMPVACTVARNMVEATLRQTGYKLQADDVLCIDCANALEPPADSTHNITRKNTRENNPAPATIVLGNPPYSNYGDTSPGAWILSLLEDYKRDLHERKLNLHDDFIKFMRRSQADIEHAGAGLMMLVTSNTYLEGVTHRRMRQSLLETFSNAYLLNLHGSRRTGAASAAPQRDENVFQGVQQGAAIGAFIRAGSQTQTAPQVQHAELRGGRLEKQRQLLHRPFSDVHWRPLQPHAPAYYFSMASSAASSSPASIASNRAYAAMLSICDLFGVYGPGVKTERDRVAVQHTRGEMQQVVEHFRTLPAATLRELYSLPPDSRDWKLAAAQADVQREAGPHNVDADPLDDPLIAPILYRPFDVRYTWYSGRTRGFVGTPGAAHSRHMLAGGNLALHVSRTVYGDVPWRDILITSSLSEFGVLAARPGNTAPLFPAYLYPESGGAMARRRAGSNSPAPPFDAMVWPAGKQGRRPNFRPAAIDRIAAATGLRFQTCGAGDLINAFGPEDILHYIYAALHSTAFRDRYNASLKTGYPRIPLCGGALFRSMTQAGQRLAGLHLMRSPLEVRTGFTGKGDRVVARGFPRFEDGRVSINPLQSFTGVPVVVWEHFTGGYQVCRKWLQDRAPRGGKRPRQARKLSDAGIQRYQQVIAAIAAGQQVVAEIDALPCE